MAFACILIHMTSQENPPILHNEEVEKYEDPRILQSSEEKFSEQKAQKEMERVIEEKGFLSKQDRQRIAEIESSFKPETSERVAEINSIPFRKPLGDEKWNGSTQYTTSTPSTKKTFFSGLKQFGIAIGLLGAATATEAKGIEKNPNDSTTEKTTAYENPKVTKTNKSSQKSTVPLYTTSKTVEGSITPTGFNNSFFENEYGIKPSDIEVMAQKHGFSTKSAAAFQEDLINYVEAHHPEVLDSVLSKYGETSYAKENRKDGIAGLKDAKLGIRTAMIMSTLTKTENGGGVILEPIPEKDTTPEGGPENSTDVFNTNGYSSLDILFDVSPSMAQHKAYLAEKLKNNTSDIPVQVIGFTDGIDTTATFSTPSEASEYLKEVKLVDKNTELLLPILEKKLQSMERKIDGKGKVVGLTDELLQKVSQSTLDSLQKLSVEKNVDLSFTVMVGEHTYILSLNDVQHAFDEAYTQILPEIQMIEQGITIRTNQIAEWENELKTTTDNATIKDLKNKIEENKGEIESFQERKEQKQLVDISNFNNIGTDLVNTK